MGTMQLTLYNSGWMFKLVSRRLQFETNRQNKICNLLMYVTFHHVLFPSNLCFILLHLSLLYTVPEYVTIHNLKLDVLVGRGCGKMCRINAQIEEH